MNRAMAEMQALEDEDYEQLSDEEKLARIEGYMNEESEEAEA